MADDNEFTSYLLKLQEKHLQIVKNLKDEVDVLKKRCQKIQACANQNALLAKRYYTKCKFLLNEREVMKAKLKQVMKDKTCKKCKSIKEQKKTNLDNSTLEKSPHLSLNGTNLSPVKKGKLSRKKVILSKPTADKNTVKSPAIYKGNKSEDSNLIESKNVNEKSFEVDGCGADERDGNKGIVFVPDTSLDFTLSDDIPVLDGSDIRTPDVKRINEGTNELITGAKSPTMFIPDTCVIQGDDLTQESLLKGPLCSSTIIQDTGNILKSPQVEDDDITMIHPQEPLKAPEFSSTTSIPKLKKFQPFANFRRINERTKELITGAKSPTKLISDTCAIQDDDVTMLDTQESLLKGPLCSSTQFVPEIQNNLKSPQVQDDDITMIHPQEPLKAPEFSSTPSIPKLQKFRPFADLELQQKIVNCVKQNSKYRSSLPKSESQYPVDLVNTQIPSPTFHREISGVLSKEEDEKVKNVTKNLSFLVQKTPTSSSLSTPISIAQKTPSSTSKENGSYLSDTSPLLLRDPKIDFQRSTTINKLCYQSSEEEEIIPSSSKKRKISDVHQNLNAKSLKSIDSKRNKTDDIEQESIIQKGKNGNSPTKHKLVQKTLTSFNSKVNANAVHKGFARSDICSSSNMQDDINFKRAIEESLQDQQASEFKKPLIPVHKRNPSTGCSDGLDQTFLNGTIDPAIDLNEYEDNSPKMKNKTEQTSPTSVVMTSGRVCIVKEVPFEEKDDLIKVQQYIADEENENLSYDDMFDEDDEEHEEEELLSKQVVDEPEISNDEVRVPVAQPMLPGNSFFKNFDVLPTSTENKPQYKCVEVVRKRDERRKLRGFECKDCEVYFSTMDLTNSQKVDRMKLCSRHRGKYSPPSTQPHYWDVDFPDTQTCLRRGYINNAPKVEEQDDTRKQLGRRKKYKKNFKAASTSKQGQ